LKAIEAAKAKAKADKAAADAAAAAAAAAALGKAGTISFYENQIKLITDEQNKLAISSAAYSKLGNEIISIQEKINSIKFKPGSIEFYDDQIKALEEQQKKVVTTSEQYYKLGEAITSVQMKIDKISENPSIASVGVKVDDVDPTSLIKTVDVVTELSAKMSGSTALIEEKGERIKAIGASVAESVSSSFNALGNSIVDSMGLASTGLEGFAASMLKTVVELAQIVLKQIIINQAASMSNVITGATAAGLATAAASPFTTPAFIATAIAGVIAAFAAIPKFQTGGIVSGNSLYGDKILARVNSGEMIANDKQQKKIWSAMNSGDSTGAVFIPDVKLKGNDIWLSFKRTEELKNRLG